VTKSALKLVRHARRANIGINTRKGLIRTKHLLFDHEARKNAILINGSAGAEVWKMLALFRDEGMKSTITTKLGAICTLFSIAD
jgi:hypothetical protein